MKTYARMTWAILVAVLVAGLALASPSAQEPGGRGSDRGAGVGPGGGRGFGPGPMLHRLNLTDAQREQVRAIMKEQREGEAPMRRVAELQRELNAAIFADAPDHGKIEELKASIAEAQAAALASRIDAQLRIAQVLTAEQRAQARELPAGPRGPRGRRG